MPGNVHDVKSRLEPRSILGSTLAHTCTTIPERHMKTGSRDTKEGTMRSVNSEVSWARKESTLDRFLKAARESPVKRLVGSSRKSREDRRESEKNALRGTKKRRRPDIQLYQVPVRRSSQVSTSERHLKSQNTPSHMLRTHHSSHTSRNKKSPTPSQEIQGSGYSSASKDVSRVRYDHKSFIGDVEKRSIQHRHKMPGSVPDVTSRLEPRSTLAHTCTTISERHKKTGSRDSEEGTWRSEDISVISKVSQARKEATLHRFLKAARESPVKRLVGSSRKSREDHRESEKDMLKETSVTNKRKRLDMSLYQVPVHRSSQASTSEQRDLKSQKTSSHMLRTQHSSHTSRVKKSSSRIRWNQRPGYSSSASDDRSPECYDHNSLVKNVVESQPIQHEHKMPGSVPDVTSRLEPRSTLVSTLAHTCTTIVERHMKTGSRDTEDGTLRSEDKSRNSMISRARAEASLHRLLKDVRESSVKRLVGSSRKSREDRRESEKRALRETTVTNKRRPDDKPLDEVSVRRSSQASTPEQCHIKTQNTPSHILKTQYSSPTSRAQESLYSPISWIQGTGYSSPASLDLSLGCCDHDSFIESVGSPSMQHEHKTDLNLSSLQTTKFAPGFIDTHCHLDMLFQRIKHSGRLSDYLRKVPFSDAFPASYEGCVTIFCKPWMFGKVNFYETLICETNIWAGFGCHPHFADKYSDVEEGHLRVALKHPKTVALGEVGLDYSGRDTNKAVQQKVLRRQLKIAVEVEKPIVIHCRDAHQDCLAILKELVPRDTLIHRHCFTDGWREAMEWLSSFPNLYLGFTNLAGYTNSPRSASIRDVIARMNLNRILLETDAPYFRPRVLSGGQHANPGMAIHVAAEVAKIRNEDIQVVLSHARRNTKAVYGV